ncbi:nuclear pore complex protein Nup85 [Chelonus insularis]|uniref:nuclear pore complex protein Nup85 n=1 Tax=Chelonus insularis TaxID=460826 RepID=UPI00158B2167|nr:nuclear pore complex protein Nup85 [Chelonus insularis]
MGDEDNPQLIGIPDDLCRRAGISATWKTGNKLGIIAYKHVNVYSGDKKSSFFPCDTRVHFLGPEIILFSPILRKLVNESNGVFLSIRKIQKSNSDEVRPELIKHSKQYRSILRACVEKCIWHLTEILYVDTLPGDVVLPQLLEWVRFHFPSRELMAMKILAKKSIGAELENMNYWEAVIGCALHGKLEIVRSLLSYHTKADHPAFVTADNILKTMPVYNVYGGYSVNEFTMRWKHWQMDLASNLEYKTFMIDHNLEELMRLFAGEEGILWDFSKYTEAWYELVAAKLLYSSPCCKQAELARHANNIAERWQAGRHLDHIILALMENEMYKVIEQIQHMNDSGWFAAHLTDLLYNCEKLNIMDEDQTNVTDKLHESLLLEYGSTLFGHSSLWQCGASYLEQCPTQVTSICKIQGIKSIRRGRLGNALAWAIKAQDGAFATYIADQFLKQYAEEGILQCEDLLENLGAYMLTSDRLTFLGKYCEFHQMYVMEEFSEAAQLLISLITSNLTPKYFWPILLTDAIPLLEAEDILLSSKDTFLLMRSVEEHGDDPAFHDKTEIFRLSAARNLARALNIETGQPEK